MIIVYTPEGGEPEQYDARALKVSEASIVQRTIDQKWGEVKQGLAEDDLDAMRAIVWVLKKRTNPSLRFAEVDPGVDEMVTRFDREEATNYVTNVVASLTADGDATKEDVARLLQNLPDMCIDAEHAEALLAKMTAEGPKAPASEQPKQNSEEPSLTPTLESPESSTSGSSLTS